MSLLWEMMSLAKEKQLSLASDILMFNAILSLGIFENVFILLLLLLRQCNCIIYNLRRCFNSSVVSVR